MLGDPVWKISIGVYYRRKDGGGPWYSRTGEQWQVTEDRWEAQGDMAVPQVLPVHMAWDGNQGHGSQFLDWFSLLCRTLRCRKSLFQRAIHCFTPFCLQFLSKYGREIPCYEPTVYTENDGVGPFLPLRTGLNPEWFPRTGTIGQTSPSWRLSVKNLVVTLSAPGALTKKNNFACIFVNSLFAERVTPV